MIRQVTKWYSVHTKEKTASCPLPTHLRNVHRTIVPYPEDGIVRSPLSLHAISSFCSLFKRILERILRQCVHADEMDHPRFRCHAAGCITVCYAFHTGVRIVRGTPIHLVFPDFLRLLYFTSCGSVSPSATPMQGAAFFPYCVPLNSRQDFETRLCGRSIFVIFRLLFRSHPSLALWIDKSSHIVITRLHKLQMNIKRRVDYTFPGQTQSEDVSASAVRIIPTSETLAKSSFIVYIAFVRIGWKLSYHLKTGDMCS